MNADIVGDRCAALTRRFHELMLLSLVVPPTSCHWWCRQQVVIGVAANKLSLVVPPTSCHWWCRQQVVIGVAAAANKLKPQTSTTVGQYSPKAFVVEAAHFNNSRSVFTNGMCCILYQLNNSQSLDIVWYVYSLEVSKNRQRGGEGVRRRVELNLHLSLYKIAKTS